MSAPAIEAEHLVKTFGDQTAVVAAVLDAYEVTADRRWLRGSLNWLLLMAMVLLKRLNVPLARDVIFLGDVAMDSNAAGELRRLIEQGAAQCGICIPGMLVSLYAFLKLNPRAGRQEVREAIGGNLCRCTGYHNIVKAIGAGARAMSGEVSKQAAE